MNRYFLIMFAALLGVISSTKAVSGLQVKPLATSEGINHYQVVCNNGEKHIIISNHEKQDFQYFYSDKGYYIKYYDMEFKSLNEFAEWVCRNK